MRTFRKRNGTHVQSSIPLKNLKMFFNMSKITTIKPVLQRDGIKNSHLLNYQINKKIYNSLG